MVQTTALVHLAVATTVVVQRRVGEARSNGDGGNGAAARHGDKEQRWLQRLEVEPATETTTGVGHLVVGTGGEAATQLREKTGDEAARGNARLLLAENTGSMVATEQRSSGDKDGAVWRAVGEGER
ncbi:hypothetical protein LR48_Vigan04g149300 [Vigna angularis]|uniref:Uncharacterized protein n=1 Tax=Phaseolus angularis TaxID=3914 RepID=A0A0L9UED1_PHAAN|nr:hypothetical protein LR48_Vigan04g149300 [Vigna angularis]